MNLSRLIRKLPELPPFDYRWGLGVAGLTILGYALSILRRGDPPGLAASQKYISGLNPRLKPLAVRFIQNAHAAGIPVVVTSGKRDDYEQLKLYEQGRTSPGPIVTNAQPGSSWHNYGLAFDVAILVGEKPTWPASNAPVWKVLGAIGAKLGLNHGASFNDVPHFDYHPSLTIAQAKSGQRLA